MAASAALPEPGGRSWYDLLSVVAATPLTAARSRLALYVTEIEAAIRSGRLQFVVAHAYGLGSLPVASTCLRRHLAMRHETAGGFDL
jgi:hypothetical protein